MTKIQYNKMRTMVGLLATSFVLMAGCQKKETKEEVIVIEQTVEPTFIAGKSTPLWAAEPSEQGTVTVNASDSEVVTPIATTTASQAIKYDVPDGPYEPNEDGRIMIFLFHHVIPEYTGGDKNVSITIDHFKKWLNDVYTAGYRPISMEDYLTNNITIAKGYIPMIITFDDGWSTQFQFLEENGEKVVDPNTAVAIMDEFNKEHPDFEKKGVFYVNLGREQTFGKVGTLSERLQYIIDQGYEIGNHTLTHENLRNIKDKETLMYQIGKNEQLLQQALPNYTFKTLALPFGAYNKDLKEYLFDGTYEGTTYHNDAVFLAGAEPALPVSSEKFKADDIIPRVLSPGIEPVYMDADWWLDPNNYSTSKQYVSDGDPTTITLPSEKTNTVPADVPTPKAGEEVAMGDGVVPTADNATTEAPINDTDITIPVD